MIVINLLLVHQKVAMISEKIKDDRMIGLNAM